jgi:predicted dinucleotide-binding enzyme
MSAKSATPYLILGTGQLGFAIMEELVAQGKDVTVVNRSGKSREALPRARWCR